jgi:hypothetical protein
LNWGSAAVASSLVVRRYFSQSIGRLRMSAYSSRPRAVGSQLFSPRVDRILRIDRRDCSPVLPRDIESLYLDVLEHFFVVTIVGDQKGVVDRSIPW